MAGCCIATQQTVLQYKVGQVEDCIAIQQGCIVARQGA